MAERAMNDSFEEDMTLPGEESSGTHCRKTRFKEGETFDDSYVVTGFLGNGSMAEVYSAYDVELRRSVALKVSREEIDADFLTTEGRLLGDLRHPGIVAVHRMGTHKGHRYLVLERLLGTTLDRHLSQRGERTPFRLEHALDILIQLCEVVETLHGAGVIHRDIKPSNVMVVPGGRLVLFDFGVALGRVASGGSDLVVGTPCYMAPELAGPVPPAPSASQDIYALGCIAFEILSGKLPFVGSTPFDILASHREEPVPMLSDHIDVPPLLERVVSVMMAKDPNDRFNSVGAVASWLRGIERGRTEATIDQSQVSVLIVDDDDDVRALLSTIVERRLSSVEVRTARDGYDALTQFAQHAPDVLLFDLDMPRVTGLELAMHLSGMPEARNSMLCAVSGRAAPTDRAILTQLGVRSFIDKTSAPDQIIDKIEHLVAEAAARKRLSL